MAPPRVPNPRPRGKPGRMTTAQRPPHATPVFFAQGEFHAERIARLYWMLTGQESTEAELEEIRQALEEERSATTTTEEQEPER